MYKETIVARKLFSIIKSFIFLLIILFLLKFIEISKIIKTNIQASVIIVSGIMLILIIVSEIFRCRIKYTYFIIANEFIIHKIKGNNNKVVENIKIKDIQYIYKKKFAFSKAKIHSSNKYIINIFKLKTYCCIYKDGERIKRFYFDPSENLLNKIKLCRSKGRLVIE